MKFSELLTNLKLETHPAGVPENLLPSYRKLAIESLIYLQRYVECLQENNTLVNDFCSTYWNCNMTVVGAPNGPIKRAYTVQSDAWCDRVILDEVSYDRILDMASTGGLNTPPENTGLTVLQTPFKFSESSTDRSSGRARHAVFARHNNRVYVYPWLHSSESLIIDWDGIKRSWTDNDTVTSDEDAQRAIRLYIEKEMARGLEHDYDRYNATTLEFNEAVRDLIYDCRENTRQRIRHVANTPEISNEFGCPARNWSLDVPASPEEEPSVFAIIGDFGTPGANTAAVAELVKSWDPEFIVSTGDNWYTAIDTLDSLDEAIGQYYADYLWPYNGKYDWINPEQARKFFATIGNHDRDPSVRLRLIMDYLGIRNPYYNVVKGPVNLLILDSGYDSSSVNRQLDGISASSKQAEWFREELAKSKSPWNLVFMHHPPYSSTAAGNTPPLAGDGTLSYPDVRWPFKDWGCDVLIHGHSHNYERYEVDGFSYISCGSGGHDLDGFIASPSENSKSRYNTKFGAMNVSATCTELILTFYDTDGVSIDTLTLTKD